MLNLNGKEVLLFNCKEPVQFPGLSFAVFEVLDSTLNEKRKKQQTIIIFSIHV
jgi:hypothetical protein